MPMDHPIDDEYLVEGLEQAARTYWPALLIEGIALFLFGILARFIPRLSLWELRLPWAGCSNTMHPAWLPCRRPTYLRWCQKRPRSGAVSNRTFCSSLSVA